MVSRSLEYLQGVVRELVKLRNETEWIEFKCNNEDPERIAKYISGISNSATLSEKTKGYLVWGIDDDTHEIVGTDFQYRKARKGAEELEAWLARMINPKINFKFYEVPMSDSVTVVLLEIPCAESEPTKYASTGYVRIGSNLKNLAEYKDREAELWRMFDKTLAELRIAKGNVTEDEVIGLLDHAKYYDKLELPLPRSREKVIKDLVAEKFIKRNDAGNWDITNLGALLIAKDFRKFEALHHRSVRVIWYKEKTRLEGVREREFSAGYAIAYEDIIQYIMTIIPQEEVLDGSTRKSVYAFPEIAIRELLANTMIHQSLEQRGTNPMVEVFTDRIEFSNAGAPLIAIERIVDTVPLSRNENMAGFMHKCGICEERGSGYDKIVSATSDNKMLAPRVQNQNNQFTKAVLFARIPFEITSKEDRIRTCYMQACLAYVEFGTIANADIRKLFDLEDKDKVKISRIIKDTVEAGLIKPLDPDTAPRYMRYVPFWA